MRKHLLTLLLAVIAISASAASWVRVNQLGYLPAATKVAVLLSQNDTVVTAFEVVDAFTGATVFTGHDLRATGALGTMRATYRLNFSALRTPGSYFLKAGNAVSPVFAVGNHVWDGAADFTLNYMRQQRCGFNPFTRDSCHLHDGYIKYHPAKEGQHLDVAGGWHDAADLLQYTTTSANAIYQLMTAYELNPQAFGDTHQANGLPGSNGIPDIVDEIYWGLQWLDKMNPEKGEIYNQIADDRDHIGMKLPHNDPADYGYGPNNGRPVYFVDGKPQQRGKFMNATMGAASTAGKFASCFALGSRLLAPFYPQFAGHIGAKADDAYQIGIAKPGNTQTVSVVSPYIYAEDNWVDDMELGAIELYRSGHDIKHFRQAVDYGRREPVTPWMGADSACHYQWYPFMNMGHYRLADAAPQGSATRAEFVRNMRAGLQRVLERGTDNPFLNGVPGVWCSNNLTTALLTQCILYRKLSGDTTYTEMEGSLRDWLLGCNPWGTSMVVELPMGGTYPTQPHSNFVAQHCGNTTGGLVDGPVYASIFSSLKGVNISTEGNPDCHNYEEFQPGYIVYHDNFHDYSTNEPTMDGTASLTFPFSAYQSEGAQAENAAAAPVCRYSQGAIIQGDPTKKLVSLVFTADDHADGTKPILNALKAQGVPGNFFLTGHFFELFPDEARQIIASGGYVSTHSYGHLLYAPWERRDSLLVTRQQFADDLRRAYDTMARFGVERAQAPLFIPPYEHYNATTAAWARQLGLQMINYTPGTRSNADYTIPSMGKRYRDSKTIYADILNYEREHTLCGHLLMVHLGTDRQRTDKFYRRLPQLIKELKRRGYRFVTVKELLNYR